MIRYALQCEHDHEFEGWFPSSDGFDDQAARGLVECPFCASKAVRKAIMSPAVAGTKKRGPATPSPSPEMQTLVMEAMAKVREHVEAEFDYVGDAFAREARDIHEGKSENRGIYGEATPAEVKKLAEEGIETAPLPPRPKPAGKMN
jgi:hypothetical protein